MQTVQRQLISGKKILLRYDLDVPLESVSSVMGHGSWKVADDFRLKAGLPTLNLCLENAEQVIILGHVGRPSGEDPNLSVAPVYKWLNEEGFREELENGKLKLLENLRFESGESFDYAQDLRDENINYAEELAALGDFFINEAFAAWYPAASTTVLPTLLPHAAGLRFVEEVNRLTEVRNNPKKPFVAVIGGTKVEDKLPAIHALAEKANAVLVGGKLASEITLSSTVVEHNVMVGVLNKDGLDIAPQTLEVWKPILMQAKMVVWNGPVGKVDSGQITLNSLGSAKGTYEIAKMLLESEAEVIVGGGDTVGFLGGLGLLGKFAEKGFISTGGGAMLKLLVKGTLPTIEVLE